MKIARKLVHIRLQRDRLEVYTEISKEPKDSLYRPSVNEMMLSACRAYKGRVLGVIMTGMGNDGCIGMRSIKENGGKTIAQDEKSCVVFGMPGSIVQCNLADAIIDIKDMSNAIVELVGGEVIEPTAFEPDASTHRNDFYYSTVTNALYRKVVTRNEPGIIVAHWQKVSN